MGEQHMELLSYQATPHHGHAVARFHEGPKPGADAVQPFGFERHPYHFYNHPAVSVYKLNKVLYESRFKPHLRQRLLKDTGAVSAEYGLPSNHAAALFETCLLAHNGTSQPALDADPVVKAGAHPVGALMAVHVLQAEQRRMQRA